LPPLAPLPSGCWNPKDLELPALPDVKLASVLSGRGEEGESVGVVELPNSEPAPNSALLTGLPVANALLPLPNNETSPLAVLSDMAMV
jgi:hypothetical protein